MSAAAEPLVRWLARVGFAPRQWAVIPKQEVTLRSQLLFIGGAVNALGVLFHVALPRLARWNDVLQCLPERTRGDLPVFNAHVGYTLLFFAVLSFGYSRELLTTPIGRTITILIGGFWLLRAASEFIWPPTISPLILSLCLAMATLYGVVALGARSSL